MRYLGVDSPFSTRQVSSSVPAVSASTAAPTDATDDDALGGWQQDRKHTAAVFDRWASWWDRAEKRNLPLYEAVLSRLSEADRRVLDVGCGTGALAVRMVQALATRRVVGVDLSPGMLEKAASRVESLGLMGRFELRLGDAQALPVGEGEFDAVVTTLSFHHYPSATKALAEFRRAVRPGGLAIIVDVDGSHPFIRLTGWLNPLLRRWLGREWHRTRAAIAKAARQVGLEVEEQVSIPYLFPAVLHGFRRPKRDRR